MDNNTTTAAAENAVTMQIDVIVRPVEPKKRLIGYASVTFGGVVIVHGFRVLQGEDGLYIGNPGRPDSASRTGYRDTARLIGDEIKDQVHSAVRSAYIAEVEKLQARAAAVAVPDKEKVEAAQDDR